MIILLMKLKQMIQGDDLWNIIAINFLSSEPVDLCELKRKLDITKKDLLQKKITSVIASSGSYEEAILSVINALSKL